MAAAVFFEAFSEHLAEGVHNFAAAGHQLDVYLSNTAPDVVNDAVKADMAEITNQNGYTAPVDVQNDTSRTGDTTSVTAVDVTITASGGSVGPFQYIVLDNDTPTTPADPLILYWNYGSALTLLDGESLLIDFGSNKLLDINPT